MTQLIKVMKTLAGDEVIGMFMSSNPERGTFSVEYPFLVNTEIDENTRTTYTDLQPYMFGTDLSGPFHFAAHSVSVMPMNPKAHLEERYRGVVEQVSQQLEQAAALQRSTTPQTRSVGSRLGKK